MGDVVEVACRGRHWRVLGRDLLPWWVSEARRRWSGLIRAG